MIANGRWRRITEVVPATSRLRHLAIGYASEKTTSKYPDFSGSLTVGSILCSRLLRADFVGDALSI
ncbi:MAG: hypothetical protein OXI63_12020 [Candidatus Poribacteria bacterium]|nr:hypothetical protein [Candidatus Poribacteria bacterium]